MLFFSLQASQLPILDGYIDLPMGYKTTRRDGLKFLSLGLALSSLGVMLTHTQVSTFGIPLRTLLLAYHIPTLVQIGIILYVFTAWGWLTKASTVVCVPPPPLRGVLSPSNALWMGDLPPPPPHCSPCHTHPHKQ